MKSSSAPIHAIASWQRWPSHWQRWCHRVDAMGARLDAVSPPFASPSDGSRPGTRGDADSARALLRLLP